MKEYKRRDNQNSKKGNEALKKWMIHGSIIIIFWSSCAFTLIQFVDNLILKRDLTYELVNSAGMLIPMAIIMWIICSLFLRITYNYISKLISAITQVADGNFDVYLNVEKAGPLREVCINFNKMTKELQSVQTLRNDFINNFSHEFKTPISSINGFALLLMEEEISKDDKNKYLKIIADESERLAELSNLTLLLSKVETQQYIIDKENYSLDEQIKECAIILYPQWSKKNIEFSAELDPILYNGNYELMQHIWINILNNAIKFTPDNGKISIIMKKYDKNIIISIADTGIGMSEEELSKIFMKYYQGDMSRSKKGLGLGLSIVKRIVELNNGNIEVSSRVSKGSVFTINLPI